MRRGNDPAAQGLGDLHRGIPQCTGGTADEQRIVRGQLQTLKEGAPGREIRLRNCSQRFPGKVALDPENDPSRKKCILRVAAVEGPAHAAHEGCDLLSGSKIRIGRICDLTDTLDAGNDRFLNIVCPDLIQPQQLFGMVQAKGFHLYQHPARTDLRDRHFGENDVFSFRDLVTYTNVDKTADLFARFLWDESLSIKNGGYYNRNIHPSRGALNAYNREHENEVWEYSLRLVGLEQESEPSPTVK